jgi:hypothetical protein
LAKKGERRYRYFVSRKLIRGTDKTDERGWRLPAEETEEAVMSALDICSQFAARWLLRSKLAALQRRS